MTTERRQTMQQFLRDGKTYWGGLHRELGLLIYDPRAQQRLAVDKVRLYVVAERRLAAFVKDLVRARLVPSRLETWWCPQHAVVMQPWHNAQGAWYSHQHTDGTWCTGQAPTTDADATAPHHAQPRRSS
jgi:hypothetical protein